MRRALLLTTALLAGCAVGPDFERPAPPSAQSYMAAPLPAQYEPEREIPADWWALFRSPALNQLVQQALANNPTLQAARAALTQSRELAKAQYAAFFPSLTGNFNGTRAKNAQVPVAPPTNSPDPYYSLYTAQLSLTYMPDVFGANRRASEAAEASAEATRYQLEATYLTLSSNVVVTAIADASFQAQVDATARLAAIAADLTDKIRRQRDAGAASELDLLSQQAQEAQILGGLAQLRKQAAQNHDALTALLGRASVDAPIERFTLDDIMAPEQLPASLPSKLVEQRPDVRQAEEQMHAASAAVGVAIADMLPQFAITGGLGSSAYQVDRLFRPGNGFWAVGGSLTQTLFDAGALLHRRRAADAALDQAAALYRAAVIAAIQNVADTLYALREDEAALNAGLSGQKSAKTAFDLARRQYAIGAVPLVTLLNAEQTYQQAEITLVTARATQYSDVAGLFQALGGGWWNRDKSAVAQAAPTAAAQ